MKRIPIVNKYHINQYNNYIDDNKPFITVSHLTTDHETEVEDFKIFLDHIEFARPTVFMEYCYNKNFPIYLEKLCNLAASTKRSMGYSMLMTAIEIIAKDILSNNLPKYLRVFEDDKLCVQNYEQECYGTQTSFAITSGYTSDKVLNEPIDYLAFVSTQMENKLYPLPLNFVIYHNGDIIFNQLSVPFATKIGDSKQFDRLLDINSMLRSVLIPRAKFLKDLYNEKYMNTWIRETVEVLTPMMEKFYVARKELEDGKG